MKKGRVGNKRKSFKEFGTELKEASEKLDNAMNKKANPKCTKCGTEMDHVKTSGLLAVYKCPNCKFTIDQWV